MFCGIIFTDEPTRNLDKNQLKNFVYIGDNYGDNNPRILALLCLYKLMAN